MSYPIKQSSTAQPIYFYMVSSSDHISPALSLSFSAAGLLISKNGGAYSAPSGAPAEIGGGMYKIAGNATDSNTLGPIAVRGLCPGADQTDDVPVYIVKYDPQQVDLGLFSQSLSAAVAADGVIPTLQQALFLMLQFLTERKRVSTTVSVNALDGSTPLATFTIDDAANPTSITRAS